MPTCFSLPPHVAQCRAVLAQAGWPAYPVGGCVRDLLLGRTPTDWDMTTAAPPAVTAALFPRSVPTGLAHGTVTVLTDGGPIEVTTFRTEGRYSDGRHPDGVTFVSSLEEDLSRRDFTVNAMALAQDGSVIDPFGGLADLEAGVLRCVGDPARRFAEDRLRMFRALRFAAQLDFALHPTLRAALASPPSPAGLAAERVQAELEKTLLSPRPQWAGELAALGLLSPWLGGAPQVDASPLALLPAEPLARWAGFLALLPTGEALLSHLALPGRLREPLRAGLALSADRLPQDARAWRHALAQVGPDGCRAAAATGGPDDLARLDAVLAGHPCVTVRDLALSGGDLAAAGLSGPAIGAAQARLLAHVLDHPEDNRRACLTALLAEAEPPHP